VSAEPASEQLTQPIRRTLPGLRPSRWTLFGSLGHLALGPPLRRRRSPRDCLSPVNLPNLNLSPKQPLTGEASGGRNFKSPIDLGIGRLELPLSAYIDGPEADRRRGEPGHASGAVGEEPIPVSR